MFKSGDRVYVTKGTHAGKHGEVIAVSGKTATVKFDNGGTYYVGTDIMEHE